YNCYSCHTKFYDLGKPVPLCPKCGADQRDADEAPVVTSHRSRARAAAAPVVVEEPVEEPDFPDAEAATPATGDEEEEELIETPEREEEPQEEEEDEEY